MADVPQTHRSSLLWVGFLLALAALLSNAIFFINPPGQNALPWLSLVVAIISVILLAIGVKRIFADARGNRARVLGSVLTVLSLGLAGVATFAFVHSRALPASTGSPRVGKQAPEFMLLDSNGRSVSLTQLLAPAAGPKPKAVLLVFYRGYW